MLYRQSSVVAKEPAMRHLALLTLSALLPLAAAAQDTAEIDAHHQVINLASELVPWCRAEAEARAIGQGHTVYQWTSSYSDRADTLEVKGKLRVEGGDFAVTCRIARGARADYGAIEMVKS
jgi:hypothetical protein